MEILSTNRGVRRILGKFSELKTKTVEQEQITTVIPSWKHKAQLKKIKHMGWNNLRGVESAWACLTKTWEQTLAERVTSRQDITNLKKIK